MPRAMGKTATTTEFDHAVGRTVQRCDVYDPRCGLREEVVDKEETLRSSGGGGVDGNAQSSPEDCRVRMLLTCIHYSRSGSAAAIGGGATVHARCGLLRHSRNAGITVAVALSVGTGSAAKPFR